MPIFARHRPDPDAYRLDPSPSDPVAVLTADPRGSPAPENFPKISAERSATIATKDSLCLRLNLELGNVRVYTDSSDQISYHATAVADSRDPGAQEFLKQFRLDARQTPWGVELEGKVPFQGLQGRFSATIEIHIPRQYSLEVNTGGGNIDVQDIDGRVSLVSAGGNITVGRVGGNSWTRAERNAAGEKTDKRKPALPIAAQIETQGGQVSVGTVIGTLRATTAGGHITVGDITGDAILRTGGGQISADHIAGAATLDTGGGNIRLGGSGSSVAADTAGGAVVLRQADAPLRVAANNGSIIAWLNGVPGSKASGETVAQKTRAPSQLSSTDGDIVLRVYVSTNGHVTDLKVIDGPPILARAAVEAVQQWQYQAPRINGRPANVVTTLVVSFRLH
jgi:TonB family protein